MGNSLNCIVFKPPQPSYTIGDPHLHMIASPNGYKIAAYFIRHRLAKFTIFFSHGNAEDIGNVFHCLIHRIPNWNCNFFVYDYAGYGLSGGRPTEFNVYRDSEVAFDYLVNDLGVDPHSIIAFGRSLGSAPSIHLAIERDILGLVLQCPIASVHRVKLKSLPFTLPGDMFCNIDRVSRIKVPTLILHGTEDDVVSVKCSQEMVKLIPNVSYHWIKGGMHNDLDYKYSHIMEQALEEFFNKILNKSQHENEQEENETTEKQENKNIKSIKFCPFSYCYAIKTGINFI